MENGIFRHNNQSKTEVIKTECKNSESAILVDYKNNKLLSKNNVACHWWSSEPTSLHYHNFYEFFIITSGCAIHQINGKEYRLKKGTLHMITPEDEHRIDPSDEGCIHINISVMPQKLLEISNSLNIEPDELLKSNPRVRLTTDEFEFFRRRAERISLLEYQNDEKFHVMICELVSQAVSVIYKNSFFTSNEYPEWFVDILYKIHSPEFCACSAADVYKLSSFSPPIIIEYFKKYTGKTVNEYIRTTKINRACDFLKKSDISILELSNMLGYTSLSHFSRVFKSYTGVTPAAYRRCQRGDIKEN